MPSAATVEAAGHVGFDFVLLDTEHGSSDMLELEHHIRAADSAGIGALVRVSSVGSPDILRALDAGAEGIVVPHVSVVQDAERAVAETHYPPLGRRSLALSTRAGRQSTSRLASHLGTAEEKILLIAQVEDAEGLENIDRILECDDLDGIFIGPADLSASLGHPGQFDHPLVRSGINQIVEAVKGKSGSRLCVLAESEKDLTYWVDQGAGLVFVNAPALIAGSLRRMAEAFASSRVDQDLDGVPSAATD
ncbi:MAG: 2,4-dihydroxyhept-2-ene-1,7-dioic acid aldolase [Actinobacteria bacterium]|nr:2,4-dihydroxyhept-2-ene-1,7-dioic acid aldolase [Actinomycetota bacterium]